MDEPFGEGGVDAEFLRDKKVDVPLLEAVDMARLMIHRNVSNLFDCRSL